MTDFEIRKKAVMLVELNRRLSAVILSNLQPEMNLCALMAKLNASNEQFARFIARPTEIPVQNLFVIFEALGPHLYEEFQRASNSANDAANLIEEISTGFIH